MLASASEEIHTMTDKRGQIDQGGRNLPGWPPRVPSKSVEGLVFQDENMMGNKVRALKDGVL